ncbi:MAG: hypothetical protein JXM73_13825 [Anaerolineae bacterium]|nr:hypothetical protein [Anaerolineae bacterium]
MNTGAATDLLDAGELVIYAMSHDGHLSLALAGAWLDPFHLSDQDCLYEDVLDTDSIPIALSVAHSHWPRLYVEAIQGLHSGWTSAEFSAFFCAQFRRYYPDIPLGDLGNMGYDVPLTICGLEPLSFTLASEHPRLAAALEGYFTINQDSSEKDFDSAHSIAWRITRSLIGQDCQPYADLALMLMYLFAQTGNDLLDHTIDEFWDAGFRPLYWERKEDLEEAQRANHQVSIVLAATERALATLDSRPDIAAALRNNILAVQTAIERNNPDVSLDWPARGRRARAARSTKRGTGPGVGLLFVRDCYAD